MITTVIIENEKKPRELLFALISGYCPRVKVVAQTDDMESGVKAIRTHRPALVFLDILLEPDTGFDVLDQVKEMDFEFIITTAYDDKKYFHKAIDNAVVKYLEKPIDPDDLLAAVSKAESIIDAKRNNGHIHKPNDNFILLPTLKGYEYKHTNEIIRLEAAKTKTVVYLTGRQDVAELNKNIGEMEKELPTEHFFSPS